MRKKGMRDSEVREKIRKRGVLGEIVRDTLMTCIKKSNITITGQYSTVQHSTVKYSTATVL
jgi:hypothetical protein